MEVPNLLSLPWSNLGWLGWDGTSIDVALGDPESLQSPATESSIHSKSIQTHRGRLDFKWKTLTTLPLSKTKCSHSHIFQRRDVTKQSSSAALRDSNSCEEFVNSLPQLSAQAFHRD